MQKCASRDRVSEIRPITVYPEIPKMFQLVNQRLFHCGVVFGWACLSAWGGGLLAATTERPTYRESGSVVRIDEQKRLIVNGVPFYPLGFFGPSGEKGLANLAEAGYNTVLCYGFGAGPDATGARVFLDRRGSMGFG